MSICYCCGLDKFQSHDIFYKCMLLYVRVTSFFVWSLSNLKTVLATHTPLLLRSISTSSLLKSMSNDWVCLNDHLGFVMFMILSIPELSFRTRVSFVMFDRDFLLKSSRFGSSDRHQLNIDLMLLIGFIQSYWLHLFLLDSRIWLGKEKNSDPNLPFWDVYPEIPRSNIQGSRPDPSKILGKWWLLFVRRDHHIHPSLTPLQCLGQHLFFLRCLLMERCHIAHILPQSGVFNMHVIIHTM